MLFFTPLTTPGKNPVKNGTENDIIVPPSVGAGESKNPQLRLREGALSQNDDALFLFVGK